jgi:tetratricopeptide (TPR) repeat protein
MDNQSVYDYELKELKEDYLTALKDLREAKAEGATRREIREHTVDIYILREELGLALLDRRQYEKGLVLYQSLPWKTYGEDKYSGIARVFNETGHNKEAKKVLEKGIKRFPHSDILWKGLGIVFEGLEEYRRSLECFERALQLVPDDPMGLFNKAFALMNLRRFEEAVAIFDSLIEKYPNEPRYLSGRGLCASEMGHHEKALRYRQKAMDLWEDSQNIPLGICIYDGLYSTYMELGMKKEAVEIASEGVKRFPDINPLLYFNLAAGLLAMGWRDEARKTIDKGLEKFPEDEDLVALLKHLDDDPDGNGNGILLGLIALTVLLKKRSRIRI